MSAFVAAVRSLRSSAYFARAVLSTSTMPKWAAHRHTAKLEVQTEGVRFLSMHLPAGATVKKGGSLTMKKCTVTGDSINVDEGC